MGGGTRLGHSSGSAARLQRKLDSSALRRVAAPGSLRRPPPGACPWGWSGRAWVRGWRLRCLSLTYPAVRSPPVVFAVERASQKRECESGAGVILSSRESGPGVGTGCRCRSAPWRMDMGRRFAAPGAPPRVERTGSPA